MPIKIFRIKIIGDRYPMDFNIQASNWAPAISRAIREWKKTSVGKGSRTNSLVITAVKSGPLLVENNGDKE